MTGVTIKGNRQKQTLTSGSSVRAFVSSFSSGLRPAVSVTVVAQEKMIPPPECSILWRGSTKSNQSDACVGRRPIEEHLYSAKAKHARLPKRYTIFWRIAWPPSIILKVDWMASSALTGLRNSIPTIMMGKMEIEFPAMYMMNRFIGTCFQGAKATSQDFLTMRFASVSLLASEWPCPNDELYPGGEASSAILSVRLWEKAKDHLWRFTGGLLPKIAAIFNHAQCWPTSALLAFQTKPNGRTAKP